MVDTEITECVIDSLKKYFEKCEYKMDVTEEYPYYVGIFKGYIKEIEEEAVIGFQCERTKADINHFADYVCEMTLSIGILSKYGIGPYGVKSAYEYNNCEWPIHFVKCRIVDDKILSLEKPIQLRFNCYSQSHKRPLDKFIVYDSVRYEINRFLDDLKKEEVRTLVRKILSENTIKHSLF